jgi:hypothetical protein
VGGIPRYKYGDSLLRFLCSFFILSTLFVLLSPCVVLSSLSAMVITRSADSANARSLRSGCAVPRRIDQALPPSRVRKASAPSSPAWKRSKNSSPSQQPQQQGSCASVQGGLSSIGTLSENVDMSSDSDIVGEYRMQAPHRNHLHKSEDNEQLGSSVLQGDANSPASTLSVVPPLTPHRSPMDAEEESPSPIPRPEDQHDIVDARE